LGGSDGGGFDIYANKIAKFEQERFRISMMFVTIRFKIRF
jgi:hypothetical protein